MFGIASVTQSPTKMLPYGYTEDQGGNNVAPLVMRGLDDLGWVKENNFGKAFVHHYGRLWRPKQKQVCALPQPHFG